MENKRFCKIKRLEKENKENNGITTARVVKEIYSKKCPECNETFTSESKAQLKWNFDVHHNACKRKAELKKQKEKKQ